MLSFMCDDGYELLGEEELVCEITTVGADWDYPSPQCSGELFS